MLGLRRPGPPAWRSLAVAREWPGDDPAVVLVPGPGDPSRSLDPLGRRLAALGLRVLAPDLPGVTVEEQAGALRAVLPGDAVLVGCSGGSRVAVEVAATAPVRALVLSGPSSGRHALRVVLGSVLEVPSRKPQLLREDLRPGLAERLRRLRAHERHPLPERLPQVPVPTVVVRGAHDTAVPADEARRVAGLLPYAVLVEVEGAAHDLHWSAPQLLARLVRQVVDGASPEVPQVPAGDPLAPPHLLGPRLHGALELSTAALALLLRRRASGRTRAVLTAAGGLALANALLLDGPTGLVRRVPLPLHRNLDSGGGLLLLLAAAVLLRSEPRAVRLGVAALGLGTVVVADATGTPVGPARVVP